MGVRKVMLLAAGVLALGAASSAGAEGGVVASASGGYGYTGTAAGSFFDVQPFTWNVQVHEDGSVHGRFNYTQVRDGVEVSARARSLARRSSATRSGSAGSSRTARARRSSVWTCGSRRRTTARVRTIRPTCRRRSERAAGRRSEVLRRPPGRAVPVPRRAGKPAGAVGLAPAKLAVATRRHARVAPERPREVALVGETRLERDLRERCVVVREPRSRPLQAQRARVLPHAEPVLAAEDSRDVRRVTPDRVRELNQRSLLGRAVVQELRTRVSHGPGRSHAARSAVATS